MDTALAGRGRHLAFAREVLDRRGSNGLLVVGRAGVGLTRLAHTFVRSAAEAGHPTLWLTATRSTAPTPLGVLAPLVADSLPRGQAADLHNLHAAGQALLASVQEHPLVLGVDDAHLLDDASATVIHQVAMTPDCFVVATLRRGEPLPGAINSIDRADTVWRLHVDDLDRADSDSVVRSILAGAVADPTLEAIWHLARGNPRLLQALVAGAAEAGVVHSRSGVWLHDGDLTATPQARDVVDERLSHLTRAARRVLGLVALGEPMAVDVLDALAGPTVLSALERMALLRITEDGLRVHAEIPYPMIGRVLAAEMSRSTRRRLSRELADVLADTGDRRQDDALRSATLTLDGGGSAPPHQLLVEGAHRAHATSDDATTLRLARAAEANGGGHEAALLVGEALLSSGQAEDAAAAFQRAEANAPGPVETLRARLRRVVTMIVHLGQAREGLALLDAWRRGVKENEWAALDAARCLALSFLGDLPQSLHAVSSVLESRHATAETFLQAVAVSTFTRACDGNAERALEDIDRAVLLPSQRADVTVTQLHLNRSLALLSLGRLAEAEQAAGVFEERVRAEGVRGGAGAARTLHGLVLLERGHVTAAHEVLEEATVDLAGRDPLHLHQSCRALLDQATAQLGETVRSAREPAPRMDHPTDRLSALQDRSAAWQSAQAGRLSAAVEYAQSGAGAAARLGNLTWQALCLHDVARFGQAATVADALAAAVAGAQGALLPALAAHTCALVDADTERLELAAEAFGAIGADLLAAEAWGQAARLWRRRHLTRKANRAATRSALSAAQCGRACTPALPRWPGALTAREGQVATLAARTLSSRDIAERLGVTVRTVDNHLSTIYSKLNVGGRHELVAALANVGSAADAPGWTLPESESNR